MVIKDTRRRLQPLRRDAWKGLLLYCLCAASTAIGQGVGARIFLVAPDSVALPAPALVQAPHAIALEFELTDKPAVVQLQFEENLSASLQVTASHWYINGDYMLRAQGMAQGTLYSLALTIGAESVFGHLSSAAGIWQIQAMGDAGHFQGWLYQPHSLGNTTTALQHDFQIPEPQHLQAPQGRLPPRLPLQLGNSPAAATVSSAAATVAGINSDNFQVTQSFDRSSVLVGGSVTATLRFENTSKQTHTDLYAEIFFVLENSTLAEASTACREQLSLSLQKVLFCELGNFAPGQVKQLTYRITASTASRPRIYSTPVIGNFRFADSIINVVNDVRGDRDGDGVSDFNENLLGTNPDSAASVARGDTVIDVMAFYTPGARVMYPLGVETRINQLVSVANQIYADSGVGIRLRPVFHGELAFDDSVDMDVALDAIINNTHPAFANVDSLRNAFGGDLVMLLRPLGQETSRCGLAPVGGYNTSGDFSAETEKQFAFAVIGIDCPSDIVVAHELGHNMGLTHSHIEDGKGGTFDFSTGYGVEGQFATVMALPAAFNASTRIAQFSNPLLECLGFLCGVDEGLPLPADAALSLSIVKYQIANFYPTRVPDLPFNPVTTLSGQPTSARIAMAASHTNGLSFADSVAPEDLVDILAEITVSDEHVGAAGKIYVLITGQDGRVFQLTSGGEFALWDGTADGLVAAHTSARLQKLERLNVLNGFRIDSALVGLEFNVYIAYEVSAIGEFVYTTAPLVVRVRATP